MFKRIGRMFDYCLFWLFIFLGMRWFRVFDMYTPEGEDGDVFAITFAISESTMERVVNY